MRRSSPDKPPIQIRFLFYLIVVLYLFFVTQIAFAAGVPEFFNLDPSALEPSSSIPIAIPNGFTSILQQTGVEVYRDRTPDFVTAVDLRKATLRNLTGTVQGELVDRQVLTRFWQEAASQNSENFQAQVLINGTFFGVDRNNAAAIAFGLKTGNHLISYGYGLNEYPGLNKTFAFDSSSAQIAPYSSATFDSAAPDVMGVLAAEADKFADRRLGRTFVGVLDSDRDTIPETVLFFSSPTATQAHAASVLEQFGATEVAMLDGGSSTGLIADGIPYIRTDRRLPHAIVIYTGKPEAL